MKISGWGRFPWVECEGMFFETREQLLDGLSGFRDCIIHARGRSYGDSALSERVLLTGDFDKILSFDPEEGIVTCESGVTFGEIMEAFLPRGWFPCTTPGTRFVSVGGAIASDVHGKNHHRAGCFSESVISFELMLPDGRVLRCSRDENRELFLSTCGGMGLTGIILEATIRLKPVESAYIRERVVRCRNLHEALHHLDQNSETTYSVAWVDCLGGGSRLGRSVLSLGEHAESGGLGLPVERDLSVPLDLPSIVLNRCSVSLFNRLYYAAHLRQAARRLTPIDSFFYPLDRIRNWNRMYGPKGFVQYQFVLPRAAGEDALTAILKRVSDSGFGSFLAVLKLLGPENDNYLSFPLEGYSLALDFKIQESLFPFLDELDKAVVGYGGRVYLAKDSRMSRAIFAESYPRWRRFSDLREDYGMNRKFHSLQSRRLGV